MRILTADGQTTRTKWPQSFLLRGSLLPHSDYKSGLEAFLRWEEAGDE